MSLIGEPRKIPKRLSSTATIMIDESRWCSWIPQWTAPVVAPAYFATPYFSVWKDFATTHFWVCECVRSNINFHPRNEDVDFDMLDISVLAFNVLNMTRTDS